MDGEHQSPSNEDAEGEDKAMLVGEEEGDERSTPSKDLTAAMAIAALSLLAMFLAMRLQVPDGLFTAPGLLPFLTGLTLLLMALGLGIKAVRQGGAAAIRQRPYQGMRTYIADEENHRALLLVGIIVVYVILIELLAFDLRLPTPVFVIRFSSYELVSIVALTLILKLFWRGTVPRCFLVSAVWVIALASVFRYGFHILLPGSG